MSKKWTRAEVLKMADAVKQVGYPEAAAMLRDLAPPDEPRQWKIGDLFRLNNVDWVINAHGVDRSCYAYRLADGCILLMKPADLATAIPLKLVEDITP